MSETAKVVSLASETKVYLRGIPVFPEGEDSALCKPHFSSDLPDVWSGDFKQLAIVPIAPTKASEVLVAFKDMPVANATMSTIFKRGKLPERWRSKHLLILGSKFLNVKSSKEFVILYDVDASGDATERRQMADEDTPPNCFAVVFRD